MKADKKIYKIDSNSSTFNTIINYALNDIEHADEIIIDTFTRFRENMKEWKGKAPLITGIIELLYFEYIKRYLQKSLEINKFRKQQSGDPKNPVYIFRSEYNDKEIILCSDIQIGEKNHIQLKLRHPDTDEPLKIQPDIFIGLEDKNSEVIPIAFIEIKLYTSMKDFREYVFKRFENLKESLKLHYSAYNPYFVVINAEAYKSDSFDREFEEFQKKFRPIFIFEKRLGCGDVE
ncbi:hypothetical protein ES705_22047 [subsurface metagenome]